MEGLLKIDVLNFLQLAVNKKFKERFEHNEQVKDLMRSAYTTLVSTSRKFDSILAWIVNAVEFSN